MDFGGDAGIGDIFCGRLEVTFSCVWWVSRSMIVSILSWNDHFSEDTISSWWWTHSSAPSSYSSCSLSSRATMSMKWLASNLHHFVFWWGWDGDALTLVAFWSRTAGAAGDSSRFKGYSSGCSSSTCCSWHSSEYIWSMDFNSHSSHAMLPGWTIMSSTMSMLKSHMHLMQYVDQVCIRCGSVKVTLCPLTSSVDGVCTCTTPSTHISVDSVMVL